MNKKSRFKAARKWLAFWTLFVGLGAVAGAAAMLARPDGSILGMQDMLPYFQVLPFAEVLFRDFVFSGISLLIVNGLTNLISAALIIANKRIGVILGGVFGITLMLWICIQFVIFPANFFSTIYFFFGLAQAITGYAAWVYSKQEDFTVNEADYQNIGTDPKKLVVYFSRMGYTKKLACEKANETGAVLYEIKSTELTQGTCGFWWCGRFGMHRWEMPIEELKVDLTEFDSVTICTPVWVFSLCGPVRAFCKIAGGKIKKADYILVHHQKNPHFNVADEMDNLLGLTNSPVQSVCCRFGEYRSKQIKE